MQPAPIAGLAQLVEQRFCKPKVTSSNLVAGTKKCLRKRPHKDRSPRFPATWGFFFVRMAAQDMLDDKAIEAAIGLR